MGGAFAAHRITAGTGNGKDRQRQGQKQIPFGDDNQRDKGKDRPL
jgi:hypothetical protein